MTDQTKDPVALRALEAVEEDITYWIRTGNVDRFVLLRDVVREAISSLKDQQAQPVEQEKRIAELEDQVQFYKSLCKAEAKAFVNEVKVQLGIAPVEQAHGAMPASSIDYHQQRGVHADIVIEAINAYDQFMLDDDYDSQGALNRIIGRMRERNALYAAPQPSPIDGKEVVAWVRRHPDGALSPNELLSDERIEESRKRSGAWVPLCRCAPASKERE